jgi:hypothetical protein
METDRIQEQPLQNFFEACGARTFQYDSFGLDWEAGSMAALSDVRRCAEKEGFEYMETGVSPAAGVGGGINGSGEFVLELSTE